MVLMVEAYQQVRGQTDQLPPYKHHDGVVCQDEQKHGTHKKVKIAEKLAVSLFITHITCGINVDKCADTTNEDQHDTAEPVEGKSDRDFKVTYGNPVKKVFMQRRRTVKEFKKESKRDKSYHCRNATAY